MTTTAVDGLALDRVTAEELEFRALSWPDRARKLPVSTVVEYAAAADLLMGIKALRAEIDATTAPVIAATHAAHKVACDQKRTLDAPLVEAERILKAGMTRFQMAEEAHRRAEEARLREIARREEEEARIDEAVRLEAAGETELAAHVLDAPPIVIAPVLPPPPKVAGISTRKLYRADVVDIRALCQAVGDGRAPSNLVTANTKALDQLAVALKESFAVPGCTVVVSTSIAAGRR